MWTRETAQIAVELAWGYEGWGQGPAGAEDEICGPTGFRNLAARYYLEAHTSVDLLSGLRPREWSDDDRARWAAALREMAEALEPEPQEGTAVVPWGCKRDEMAVRLLDSIRHPVRDAIVVSSILVHDAEGTRNFGVQCELAEYDGDVNAWRHAVELLSMRSDQFVRDLVHAMVTNAAAKRTTGDAREEAEADNAPIEDAGMGS